MKKKAKDVDCSAGTCISGNWDWRTDERIRKEDRLYRLLGGSIVIALFCAAGGFLLALTMTGFIR